MVHPTTLSLPVPWAVRAPCLQEEDQNTGENMFEGAEFLPPKAKEKFQDFELPDDDAVFSKGKEDAEAATEDLPLDGGKAAAAASRRGRSGGAAAEKPEKVRPRAQMAGCYQAGAGLLAGWVCGRWAAGGGRWARVLRGAFQAL